MSPAAAASDAAGQIPARDLLARVAEALDDAARTAREVEAVAAKAAEAQARDPAAIASLQRLDLMTQTIADLARLLAVLAPSAGQPAHPVAPLAGHLRLDGLRTRLFGLSAAPAAHVTARGGELDLF